MPTNQDFRDLFAALNDAGAEYLVVGALLIKNKLASGRLQDLADVEQLGVKVPAPKK